MAISQTHFRSISLPSRLQSTSTDFETHLQKLKSLQAASANSQAIQSGLLMIAEMYTSVEEIAHSHHKSIVLDEKSTEESLSGSVELLDYCSAVAGLLQSMKENLQALQSALRRKGMGSNVHSDVALYFSRRKRMSKSAAETLRSLKKSRHVTKSGSDSDFCSVFGELKRAAIAVLKSVAEFLCSPVNMWSRTVMMVTKYGRESGGFASEVGNVELGLSSLQKMRRFDGDRVVGVQKGLHGLEEIVEGFEGGLERLFRQLVRIRVTLLNILTDY